MTRALRDSGVGWLGMTPDDWPVLPARAVFGERKQKSNAADVHLTPSQKYGVLPQAEYMAITGNKVVLNLSGADNMRHVEEGDYVSHLRSFQGGLEFSGMSGKVSAAYTVLKPKLPLEPRFFKYLFKSDLYIQALQTTTDQLRDGQSIRYGQFTLIPLPYPEFGEQRAIADYLDSETAQIDAFIAENEELITLLIERRTAVIDLAIRDGAAATAKLGVLLRGLKDGTHGSFARIESAHPLLGARNVQGGQLVLDGNESTISEDDHSAIVANGFPRRGDVLLVIVGATIGKSAVYERSESLSFQRSVAFLRPGRLLTSRFLWYYTQTRAFQDEVWLRAKVSAQPGLYLGDVASIPIALPDLVAQQDITARLDRDFAAADKAISVARTAIELARERRAALISAAVTGKIYVGVAK